MSAKSAQVDRPNAPDLIPDGLSSEEAHQRLERNGANSVADPSPHPIVRALAKFWAPVPWMLESAIVLQLFLREYLEAGAVAFLLIFNAVLGFFQEGRAQATLDALKSRLAVTASTRRDKAWRTLPAPELVQGDIVKLSLGAVVPADVRLIQGSVLVDQSTLTGESMPAEVGPKSSTYAGALVQRGEASRRSLPSGPRPSSGAAPSSSERLTSKALNRRRFCESCSTSRSSTAV